MSTIVERPLSAFPMPDPSSVVPQRRQRDSVEVIDVDSFEDTAPHPAQRRRVEPPLDVIELLDSDDEQTAGPGPSGSFGTHGSRRDAHRSSPVFSGSGSGSGSTSAHASRGFWSAGGAIAGSSSQARRRQYISPPPPVLMPGTIPPVPPLPHRYSTFSSFPPALVPRPRGPRVSPPPSSNLNANAGSSSSTVPLPIRPLSRPLSFELLSSPPPEPIRAPVAETAPARRHEDDLYDFRPAAPARHNPPMGLGGALISSNNARLAAERLERQRRAERRVAGGRYAPLVAMSADGAGGSGSGGRRSAASGAGIMRRLANLNPLRWGDDAQQQRVNDVSLLALARRDGDDADGNERTRDDAQFALDLYLRDQEDSMYARFTHPARAFARRELALLRGWTGGAAKDDEDYRKEWTHPGSAEAGYVFDFAPSEIVPLVTGKGKGKEVVIDVDAEKDSVSTLLVCAKCLDPLLVRSDGITEGGEVEVRRRKVWGLRCGHLIDGKCYEELRRPVEDEEAAPASKPDDDDIDAPPDPKGKGKGKAKAKAPARDFEDEDEHDELFDEDLTPDIRSRLRARPSGTSLAPSAFELAVPSARRRRRAAPKRKGKAKPKKPVVEARYEWACPVAGCGCMHTSEKIEGTWVNAADKGAVGLFV
ncbi:hypothetical protein DFH09DRAFT_1418871 [Mycena vulgaris]|nr:hypothetical protein DFH09DRAFT_1418871 [Mycena vulgaris]